MEIRTTSVLVKKQHREGYIVAAVIHSPPLVPSLNVLHLVVR